MPAVRMRAALIRHLAACVAFLLPAGVAFLGKYLDRSSFRSNAAYKAVIPAVVCGSLVLALAVPTVLVMRAQIPLIYRFGITVGIWFLLALELYWLFFVVVLAP